MKKNFVLAHLAAFAIIAILHILVYAGLQQVNFSRAADPQTEMANEIANSIRKDIAVDHYFSQNPADLSWSSLPFVVLYDSALRPVKYSATLNGKPPEIPVRVLEQSDRYGSQKISWEPGNGKRMAVALDYVGKSGISVVAVGRSLKHIEETTANLIKIIFLSWIVCILVLGTHWVISGKPDTRI
jgi:hypothetical protein